MNDILPEEALQSQRLEAACRDHGHGYGEIRPPLLEHTAPFTHQIGETTVPPERTAGAARAYVEHEVHAREPVTRGAGDTRTRYRQALLAHFAPMRDRLSEDSLLSEHDAVHFQGVRRGLDDYTRTLVELRTSAGDLDGQNALVGGGRYDQVIASLGGPPAPANGFAMGLERVLATTPRADHRDVPDCYLLLARELQALGLRAEMDGRGGRLKAMLRRADALGAKLCVIFGLSEVDRGVVAVKDLAGRTREELPIGGAAHALADKLARIAADGAASAGGKR